MSSDCLPVSDSECVRVMVMLVTTFTTTRHGGGGCLSTCPCRANLQLLMPVIK